MSYKTKPLLILILLLGYTASFAQSTFQGLTPGKSTKADAERKLGQPVKEISKIFYEYASKSVTPDGRVSSGKIYVQYRKDTTVIERIEMLCAAACSGILETTGTPRLEATSFKDKGSDIEKRLSYYGSPLFAVLTTQKVDEPPFQASRSSDIYNRASGLRLAFYSVELYKETIPAVSGKEDEASESASIWQAIMNTASLEGKNLTYYVGTTPENCRSDCGVNAQCKGFTYIRAGAYNPNDPPMCYLASEVTGSATHSCCISAIKKK